jgi:phage terminase large subunit-like protein
VKFDFLREECIRAKESPSKQNSFRRLYLNQWTEQDTRWIDMGVWVECGREVDAAELEGRTCFAGLDLSSSTDLSALVLLFPPKEKKEETDEDEPYRVLCYFWIPEENIAQRVRRDRVPYDVWAQSGFIEATDGNVIDYEVIRAHIKALSQRFDIREIAYDRWGATQLSTQLQGDGLTIVPFGQGYASMSPAAKEFEKLLLGRQIAHGGNPVLAWMASNVAIKQDPAGNIKPDKGADRVDGRDGRNVVVPPADCAFSPTYVYGCPCNSPWHFPPKCQLRLSFRRSRRTSTGSRASWQWGATGRWA